jgi:hypothetical protein
MSTTLVLGAGRMARIGLATLVAHAAVDRSIAATRDVERAGDSAEGLGDASDGASARGALDAQRVAEGCERRVAQRQIVELGRVEWRPMVSMRRAHLTRLVVRSGTRVAGVTATQSAGVTHSTAWAESP